MGKLWFSNRIECKLRTGSAIRMINIWFFCIFSIMCGCGLSRYCPHKSWVDGCDEPAPIFQGIGNARIAKSQSSRKERLASWRVIKMSQSSSGILLWSAYIRWRMVTYLMMSAMTVHLVRLMVRLADGGTYLANFPAWRMFILSIINSNGQTNTIF